MKLFIKKKEFYMGIRKNFGKFWISGLIFAIIVGGFNWAISYLNVGLYWYFQPQWL